MTINWVITFHKMIPHMLESLLNEGATTVFGGSQAVLRKIEPRQHGVESPNV